MLPWAGEGSVQIRGGSTQEPCRITGGVFYQVVSSHRTMESQAGTDCCSCLELDAPWHVWREGSGTPACLSCSSKGAAKLWIHSSVSCSGLLLCENTERDHFAASRSILGSCEDIPRPGRICVMKQINSASPLEPFLFRDGTLATCLEKKGGVS